MEIVYDDDRPAPGDGGARARPARSAAKAGCRRSGPRWSTASSRTRSRSTSTRCATHRRRASSAGSWSTSRRPACTRATPRARSRRRRSPRRRARRRSKRTRARSPTRSTSSGLLNVQYAVKDGTVFVHRGEPAREPHRAVREQGDRCAAREGRGARRWSARRSPSCAPKGCCVRRPTATTSSVKEAVLPFNRFPDVDTLLGPEMRSTGEVMGIDRTFGMAFAKSQAGAGNTLAAARARCSSRSPTATRPPGSSRRAASPSSGSRSRPPPAPPHALEDERRSRSRRSWPRSARTGGGVDAVDLISSGKVDLSSTRRAAGARGPTACTSGGPPSRTASPASRPWPRRSPPRPGIAEAVSREPEVRSLQSYHRDGQLRLEV